MSAGSLPAFLASLSHDEDDDRSVPALGLGDQEAAVGLLAATRSVLAARTEEEVVTAVARFGLAMGGRLVPAGKDAGTAVPLDIALGSGSPVLLDAEAPSLARMRLEQFLPIVLEDARTAISRLRAVEEAQRASETDPLTGLLSRRALMRRLALLEIGDVVCLLDIDHFKAVNESAGHVGGDAVLRDLGRLVAEIIRGDDCAGRYGGDEIVIVLTAVPESVAAERLELLQDLWAAARPLPVTFSAGAAALDADGWKVALARADAAMYLAKGQGPSRRGA